ncbi:succinate dehydrogenase, hydrophobic membrane anchor protein [Dokdonella sp.]|uniref:succinate dehydrogenase, hydrophobic membrane anchor protein n=1 Tax=Dokdonella sp. TaxID=2291710 RepID=UPI0031BF99A3|nr:succinate dehydrogenase, hydrophobic membrane anchor protein [Dokdonella sp.]
MSTFRTPLKRALVLGSAKHGVHHFLVQRLTAIALVLLGLWFVWFALRLPGLDYAAARALLAEPVNALLMLLFVVAVFWHAQLGLQVVVEDYVHTSGWQLVLQVAIRFLCVLGGAACVLAILRIALGR